jgi:hypothetical protein
MHHNHSLKETLLYLVSAIVSVVKAQDASLQGSEVAQDLDR